MNEIENHLRDFFQEESRYQIQESNNIGYRLSELLFKGAFAVIGFGVYRLIPKEGLAIPELILIQMKMGLVFLGFSVLFGVISMIEETAFFRNHANLAHEAALFMTAVRADPNDRESAKKLESIIEKLNGMSSSSNVCYLYAQIFFLFLGTLMQISDLLS